MTKFKNMLYAQSSEHYGKNKSTSVNNVQVRVNMKYRLFHININSSTIGTVVKSCGFWVL